jgi:hypothetical protein
MFDFTFLIFDSLSQPTLTYNLHLLTYARKNAYLHRGDNSRDESSKTAGCERAMVNCLYSRTMLLAFSRQNYLYFKSGKVSQLLSCSNISLSGSSDSG